jgi:ketosteroid isomerase-like protein
VAIARAFNAHDLDAIMEFFADDCSLDMPRGPEPWGQRFIGKAAVREGLATRFKGLQTSTTVRIDTGSAAMWAFPSGF